MEGLIKFQIDISWHRNAFNIVAYLYLL